MATHNTLHTQCDLLRHKPQKADQMFGEPHHGSGAILIPAVNSPSLFPRHAWTHEWWAEPSLFPPSVICAHHMSYAHVICHMRMSYAHVRRRDSPPPWWKPIVTNGQIIQSEAGPWLNYLQIPVIASIARGHKRLNNPMRGSMEPRIAQLSR